MTAAARTARLAPTAGQRACDLCGGTRFQELSRKDRRGGELVTEICAACGLVSHQRIPSESELNEFYSKNYRQEYHGEISPSPRRILRAWRNGQRIYAQLRPSLSGDEVVFEVGAGIGCNLKQFELAGHVASGIEPGEGFLEYSQRHLRAQVSRGTLFELPAAPQCDLALLIHVIEHLREPTRSLLHLRSLLRPAGRLYLECPNLAAPFATRGRMFHFAHIYNYTPDSLKLLANKCGFEVERTFSTQDDPNLQMLLRRREGTFPAPVAVDGDRCATTLQRIDRLGAIAYHLRPSYLLARAAKIAAYAEERLRAARQTPLIEEQCRLAAGKAERLRGDEKAA